MAAQEEKVLVKADLDAANLISEAFKAKKALGEMADTESMAELVSHFKHAGVGLGVVAAAAYAAKTALDFTLEAESIKRVNSQFEMLTQSAGIATRDLEEGLKRVSDGLVDDTDLLQAANQAIIGMGKSAERLPEIFTLARKATQVFGGDLIRNFETINQALATGQTRTLKQFGIVVNAEDALAKYGKTIGKVSDALTESDKRQAIFNAGLEAGEKRFSGIKVSADSAGAELKKLGAVWNDLKETVAVLIERLVGPSVRQTLKGFTDFTKQISLDIKSIFGNAKESAQADLEDIEQRIKNTQKSIHEGQKLLMGPREKQGFFASLFGQDMTAVEAEQKRLEKHLKFLQAEAEKYKKAVEEQTEVKKKSAETTDTVVKKELDQVEVGRQLLSDARQLQMMEAAKLAAIKSRMEVETEASEMERLYSQQRTLLLEQEKIKLMELDGQRRMNQISEATYQELIRTTHEKTLTDITALEIKANDARLEAAENLYKRQRAGMQGFADGARYAATSATKDFGNMAAIGKRSFDAFGDAAAKSLMKLGDGSANAAEAMGGFFLGALGDIAEAQGRLMLLSAIFPPNPAAAAGGAALLVLAGFLKSKAGAAGGGGAGATAGGEAGGGGLSLSGPDEAGLREAEKKQIKREVTIQIQGHYLDTEGSRRELMNMIRQESDATDFKYVQIGQGA